MPERVSVWLAVCVPVLCHVVVTATAVELSVSMLLCKTRFKAELETGCNCDSMHDLGANASQSIAVIVDLVERKEPHTY